MEIGGLQIMITAVLIVSAAGIALLCDFLRARNQQLQEAMAELRVRRAEDALRAFTAQQHRSLVTAQPAVKIERKPVVSTRAPAMQPIVQRPAAPKLIGGKPRSAERSTADSLVRKSNPAPRF